MKLVMTLLVRDEQDIIAANMDFHLAHGVDYIIAMDNLSQDCTPEILRRYERRGLARYIHQPDDTYAQHRWVTSMAHLASTELGADWVIHSDADEFWWPEDGDLKRTLAAVDQRSVAAVARRTNFLPPCGPADMFFADAMTVRERHSVNALGKPLRGKVCHRALANIEVRQGNHAVYLDGCIVPPVSVPITILHYPVRSYEQFENKIIKGGAAYARNSYLPPEIGDTWRRLYEEWQRGELRARFDEMSLDAAGIEAGLKAGRLVSDDRLKRFFDERAVCPSRGAGPDA